VGCVPAIYFGLCSGSLLAVTALSSITLMIRPPRTPLFSVMTLEEFKTGLSPVLGPEFA